MLAPLLPKTCGAGGILLLHLPGIHRGQQGIDFGLIQYICQCPGLLAAIIIIGPSGIFYSGGMAGGRRGCIRGRTPADPPVGANLVFALPEGSILVFALPNAGANLFLSQHFEIGRGRTQGSPLRAGDG